MYMQRALSSFMREDWTQCRTCNAFFCVLLKQQVNGKIDTYNAYRQKKRAPLPSSRQSAQASAYSTSRKYFQEYRARAQFGGTKRAAEAKVGNISPLKEKKPSTSHIVGFSRSHVLCTGRLKSKP